MRLSLLTRITVPRKTCHALLPTWKSSGSVSHNSHCDDSAGTKMGTILHRIGRSRRSSCRTRLRYESAQPPLPLICHVKYQNRPLPLGTFCMTSSRSSSNSTTILGEFLMQILHSCRRTLVMLFVQEHK